VITLIMIHLVALHKIGGKTGWAITFFKETITLIVQRNQKKIDTIQHEAKNADWLHMKFCERETPAFEGVRILYRRIRPLNGSRWNVFILTAKLKKAKGIDNGRNKSHISVR